MLIKNGRVKGLKVNTLKQPMGGKRGDLTANRRENRGSNEWRVN